MVKGPPAMQETRVQSLGQEDPLQKEMATHCSILAWRIPWTEEPGRLQSMESQRRTQLSELLQLTFKIALLVKGGKRGVGTVTIWPHSDYLEIIMPTLMTKFFLERLYAFTACKGAQSRKKPGRAARGQALNFIAQWIRNQKNPGSSPASTFLIVNSGANYLGSE